MEATTEEQVPTADLLSKGINGLKAATELIHAALDDGAEPELREKAHAALELLESATIGLLAAAHNAAGAAEALRKELVDGD